jgi:hypothetical protein
MLLRSFARAGGRRAPVQSVTNNPRGHWLGWPSAGVIVYAAYGHSGEIGLMPDEMFFSSDERALVRGRRAAARTETCRPCLLTIQDGREVQGVILNLNAHGVLVRVMEPLAEGVVANVQMMRDDAFSKPMSPPRLGKVVRLDATDGNFYDFAFRFASRELPGRRLIVARPARAAATKQPRAQSRMQVLDLMLDGARRRR